MTVFGPDVSTFQTGLVPPKPPGIAFGICRATKGVERDATAAAVISWCQTNKVPFSAYHFAVPLSVHDAAAQAAAFSTAVGKDKTIPCMLDWERSKEGWEPSFSDALAIIDAIRKLGHKVPLLYTGNWYWELKGSPSLTGHGFDLATAHYDNTKTGTPQQIYAARGGDNGPGWAPYGGLTPMFWQFTNQATWGNRNLDFNAYRGDPTRLGTWFRTWTGDTVAETLYPYGYSDQKLTMAQTEAKLTVKNAHKEFWRRLKRMMVDSGGKIGVGTLWRSTDVQRSVFLDRHYVVPSGGCCLFEGRHYQLKKGVAHAAPPGRSFHEAVFYGYAAACDVVGDLAWMHANEAKYGLKDFRTVGNEPWHIQFAELPNSVTAWIAAGRPTPKIWDLPGEPTIPHPPEKPPLPAMPKTGAAREMYLVMKYGGQGSTSGWGGYYSDGNKRYAITPESGGMDHVARLVRAGAVDAKTGVKVTSATWDGVTWTGTTADLTKYLGPA